MGLNSIKEYKVKNGVLFLVYQTDDVLKKIYSDEFVTIVQKTVLELTQLDLKVSCIVISADGKTSTEVKPGSLLAAGLNLGGKITDIHD